MLERDYQRHVIPTVKGLFPKGECDVIKNNAGYRQGIPDLTIFLPCLWGWLEVKVSATAPQEPNQEWYIDWANRIGQFASFIYPENEKEVLDALVQAYQLRRYALETSQRQ